MDQREALFQAVNALCNAWTAFQLAIQQGFGGQDSEEKGKWFPNALTDWCLQNRKDLDQFEIAETIDQMLINDLNVICPEEEITGISNQIHQIFKAILLNNKDAYSELTSRIPKSSAAKESELIENSDESGDEVVVAEIKRPEQKLPQIDEDGFETVTTKSSHFSKKMQEKIAKQRELLEEE